MTARSTTRPGGSAVARTVLMNPGPVNTDETVRAALGGPDLCHREPEFGALMTRVRRKITAVCGGGDDHTSVVLTGSGTSALEAAVACAVPAGGALLVVDNGHYGQRLHDIARAHGIRCVRLELGWGTPVDADRVDRELAADPGLTHLAVVHHETSTGMLNDVAALAKVARAHGRRIIVDAVSSVGAESLDLARDGIDWLVGTANKCLEGMPGLAFVCASRQAFEDLATHPRRSYYLDLHRHYAAQEKAQAPAFTPAVPLFYAFETALDLALAEGVAARGRRYGALAGRLRTGLAALGLHIPLDPRHRAVSLTVVRLPEGVRYAHLHRALKDEGFVVYAAQEELSAGFFRLSTMGTMDARDIDRFLSVLSRILPGLRELTAGGEAA
ncbi:2-aminoethylphosphonate aminotransferase [Streptomyces sp. SKN60]|uniref:2-aminoethylphosphonate aminotransferase n=1 Tax=Streptomyces sp. SKN60 TaxID=2855506 RepID=UPI002248538C|nr:2-aminoethylphosphonate aminotransferase [Streptomyces sp. SKN60]MCX2182005.1 2-aminoethylphosphonate aminotransferase [Streptomyces sp. SKN60]